MAIAQRAAQCALGLEGMLQLTATEDARLEWENQIFRFNLWSANNFVFAPTRASMDWRLRNAPLLESSMCELLDDLQSSLIRCTAMMKNPAIPDEANPSTLVSDTLEELFRLSRAVRRSGILRRFVKIESYIEFDENGVNLTDEFRKGVERLIEYRLRHSPASQVLQARVVNTICLRQQHFAYLRDKWEKRTVRPTPIKPAPAQPRSSLGATFSVRGSISSPASPAGKKERVTLPTVMTATTARPERVRAVRSLKSAASAEHEDVECSQEDLPLPPKVPPRAIEKHVIQDIMPYFCIFDDCPTTKTLFESGRDWLKHMRDRHMVTGWTCMDQSHDTTLIFEAESAFKDHMYTCHTGEFADDELDEIADASHQRLAPHNLLTTCPFCPTDLTATIPADGMMSHVAEHMLSLAHISVSWQMDGESIDSQSSSGGYSLLYSQLGFPPGPKRTRRPQSAVMGIAGGFIGQRRSRSQRAPYMKMGNAGGYLIQGRSRSRRPQYAVMGKAALYFGGRGGSLEERLQQDFPSPDDDNNATPDEEYTHVDGSLPEGDMEFFKSLWRDVRQELRLPSLTSPPRSLEEIQTQGQSPLDAGLSFDADMSEVKNDVDDNEPNVIDLDYDQLEALADFDPRVPPRDLSTRYPRSDFDEESDRYPNPPRRRNRDFHHEHRYGEPSPPPPLPRLIRRQSSLDTFDRRLSHEVVPFEEHRGFRPGPVVISSHPPFHLGGRRDLDDEDLVQQREHEYEIGVERKPYPRRGNTQVPLRLVNTNAMRETGYPYRKEGDFFIIEKALSKEQIVDLIDRSHQMHIEDPEAKIVWIDTHLPPVRQKDRQENDQLTRLERREGENEEPAVAPKQYLRKGETRFPRGLVHPRVIRELGYPYQEYRDVTGDEGLLGGDGAHKVRRKRTKPVGQEKL
ncbi:hypothetical protein BJX68DRAFT_264043 [Aspergillus pseudodeflectus]|uniref:DUF8035 domain-containing protein n=1 Tax=Aspergillus pseudodeflectus TaxID=176178 RepID=A0ABR4KV79_9EURO